jgi:hypothetical protein
VGAPNKRGGEVGCGSSLTQFELRRLLGPAAFAVLDRRGLEQAVATDPTLHLCPTPDCPYVVSWYSPQDSDAGDPPAIDCPVCKKHRCLICGVEPFHRGQPCAPRSRGSASGGGSDSEEALTLAFISSASNNIRICRRCGQGVVKEHGCDKVKCRCGFRFCHGCGSENAQCSCTPATHGFIDNVTGEKDFSSLFSAKSPDMCEQRGKAGKGKGKGTGKGKDNRTGARLVDLLEATQEDADLQAALRASLEDDEQERDPELAQALAISQNDYANLAGPPAKRARAADQDCAGAIEFVDLTA